MTSDEAGFGTKRVLLLLLFAGSGCSALIYEIVWYQLLQLAIGSTAVSLGILLATFMGGLCIGSYALPRLLPRLRFHPLLVYAGIEAAIALFGLAELLIIPLIDAAYVSGAQGGLAGMLMRGLVAAVALMPPTILMGASLPAIVRWVQSDARGASWWGQLYGANSMGAVAGCLIAGFYLLRLSDVRVTTFAAAGLNILVAIVSTVLAARVPATIAAPAAAPASGRRDWSIYFTIACSGASALGAEIVWTRLMGLMFGATVYAFSIILAVFLAGLALGTTIGSQLAHKVAPRNALGWCQILAALGIAWTAYAIADALPYWPIDPTLASSPRFTFEIDLARCLWAILPPTFAWGASFPLAFAAAEQGDPGRTVGGIYAANTLGAIIGALAVSLILIPWLGTLGSQRLMLGVAAAGGLAMLLPPMWKSENGGGAAVLGAMLCLLGVLGWKMNAVPGELIAYGRRIAQDMGYSQILYTGEGLNTSIAVSRWLSSGALQFHVAGKVEASTIGADMKLQRMLGHIPALMHDDPKSVLVVGFGAGVTAGSFTTYPGISRIVICELEPLIPPTSTRFFAPQNYNVMNDRRTQIVFDDARHFVLTTPEKFDIITSDPIHPFVKGSAALYSKEYFEMVKAHLNPGGIVTQWVPLYESDLPSVKSEIATFFAVFPGAMVFANTDRNAGYDTVLVGQRDPGKIDMDRITQKLASQSHKKVLASMQDAGIESADQLFATYAASDSDLKSWLADAEINHDYDMRLQYLAGLALNRDNATLIQQQIDSHQTTPTAHFSGAPAVLEELFAHIHGRVMAGPASD